MTFNIRAMSIKDLPAVESIQAEAYAGYFLESADVIAQRFHSSPATAWVAEQKEIVCAYLVSYWSKIGTVNPLNAPFKMDEDANCLYLHDLALLKSAQGAGLGRKLVQAANNYAVNESAAAIALLSVQNSKEFWQGIGFLEFTGLEERQRENLTTYLTDDDSAFYMVKHLG